MWNNISQKVPLCVIVSAQFYAVQTDRCLVWFIHYAKFSKVVTANLHNLTSSIFTFNLYILIDNDSPSPQDVISSSLV